jgi:hypothetical protein
VGGVELVGGSSFLIISVSARMLESERFSTVDSGGTVLRNSSMGSC